MGTNPSACARLRTDSMASSPPAASKCCTTTAMPARVLNLQTPNSWVFRIGWSRGSAASRRAASRTPGAATPATRILRSMMQWPSSAHVWAASVALALALLGGTAAHADQQRDPALRAVIERAIAQAECFTDRYDSAVWYKMMEPKLRKLVPSEAERMDMLRVIYCETHRAGETRLPAGLIMGLMSVESGFNRYAVSSAGAV